MEYPTLSNQITYGDIAQAIAIFIAGCALFVGWLQIKAGNRQKRAEFIVNLYNQFSLNKELLGIYYKIEYNKFKYDSAVFHNSEEEKLVDNLLRFFNNVAELYLSGNFTINDLEYLSYNYIVVYQNTSIRKYFVSLDKWYSDRRLKVRPFNAFRRVGEVLEKKYFNKR
jgi:hypothetical protein